MDLYILSQVLTGVSALFYVGSMLSKKRLWMVILLICSDFIFGSHYLCLGAYTGGFLVLVDILFLIATFLIEKYGNKKYSYIASIVAMAVAGTVCGLTWAGPISLFPLFSLVAYFVGMFFPQIAINKIGATCRNILNICYMILLTSYVGAGIEFVLMTSAIVGAVLDFRRNKKEKQKELTDKEKEANLENKNA